jgi:formyl-CoA transferase
MLIQTTAYDDEPVTQPGIVPKLSSTPGQILNRAPKIGEHTDQVLKQAGFDESALAALRTKGVIK